MLAGKKVRLYNDNADKVSGMTELTVDKNGELQVEVQPGGGFVIK